MEMFNDPDFKEAKLSHLLAWARMKKVDWTHTQTKHVRYRATTTIEGETRLIAVGPTLKRCLWMAYKMLATMIK